MSFDDFMTDNITVRKQSGDVLEGLKASVQRDKIFLERSDVLIEPRDLIERRMSNGAVETFEVIDPGFHEAFHGINALNTLLGLRKAELANRHLVVRINNHSVDQSTNTVNIGTDLHEYIDGLRQVIQSLTDAQQKQNALEIVDAVEVQLASPKPSKMVVSTLLQALPHVASIATLASAIISAL